MHTSDALSHVARRLAATGTDLGAAMALLANNCVTLLAAEGAVVARIDGDQFRVEAAAGSLMPMVGFQAPLAGSLAADALARGHAVLVNEVSDDPRVDVHFLTPFNPRHVAIAPLVAGHDPSGFLLVLNSERGGFSISDSMVLQRLADFGAIALVQVTGSRHAEAAAFDEACLSHVVREMNQSLELERVVSLVARHAARVTDARGARVMLVEAAGLSIVAAVGDAADAVGTTVDPAGQFAQRAIEHLSGARTSDLRSYADAWQRAPAGRGESDGDGRPNGLAVPLIVGSRAIGAISVFGNESRDFDERDQSILQSLADHAAIAVENARLYRAAAYMARHANVLAASARALAVNPTPEAVMAGIARGVHRPWRRRVQRVPRQPGHPPSRSRAHGGRGHRDHQLDSQSILVHGGGRGYGVGHASLRVGCRVVVPHAEPDRASRPTARPTCGRSRFSRCQPMVRNTACSCSAS